VATTSVRKVGITVHRTNHQAWQLGKELIAWLQQEAGVQVLLDEQTAKRLERPDLSCCASVWEAVDFVVTLGGDGTILSAARMAAPNGVPVLGVYMGRFGFIAESHPSTLYADLRRALSGNVRIEERMMIEAEVWRNGTCVHTNLGLNDAVVKSATSSLLNLRLQLGGAPFATYPADGLIIATSTGSTAYSLSAGGPIVAPTMGALILTPICPHTLSARPMVIPCHDVIEIHIEDSGGDVLFKMDGVDPFPIQHNDRVIVRRSRFVTKLIVLDHATFYQKVRARYLYGERLDEPDGLDPES
jgi:NAD+ kinase